MKESTTYEIYYDEKGDFLELYFGEPSECNTKEIEDGIFVRKDKKTNEIKSIEFLAFRKRGAHILARILSQMNLNFPLKINF